MKRKLVQTGVRKLECRLWGTPGADVVIGGTLIVEGHMLVHKKGETQRKHKTEKGPQAHPYLPKNQDQAPQEGQHKTCNNK